MNKHFEQTLYKNHGDAIGYWTVQALANDARGVVRIAYAKKLGGQEVVKEYDVERKNVGRANETTFIMQAVFEAQSRVNKQLDKGYVRSLEEANVPATNSLGLVRPMLAHPIDKVKPEAIDWETAFGQPKLDGHRCMVDGILYSRQGKEIKLPHIREQLGDLGLLNAKLDGELYIHGVLLQDIGSLIKAPREESLALEYHIYDMVGPQPYSERMEMIAEALGANMSTAPNLTQVASIQVTSRDELNELHKNFLSHGFEGSILRHGKAGYMDGKRSVNLLKVKDFSEAEFTVVDVERGKPNGEFEAPVWVCLNEDAAADSQLFRVTAAGTMQEKHEQWLNRENHFGRQLTVQFFGHSKDGVPLLPVALRWREDV